MFEDRQDLMPLYERLREAEEKEQYASARLIYDDLRQRDPGNPALHIMESRCLNMLAAFGESERLLGEVEKGLPEELRGEWCEALAEKRSGQGKFEDAMSLLRKAHGYLGEPHLLTEASICALALQEFGKAEFLCREALKEESEIPAAAVQLAHILIAQQRYDEAEDAVLKSLAAEKNDDVVILLEDLQRREALKDFLEDH